MKRLMCMLLSAALLLALLPMGVLAAELSPADEGWITDNNNFSGWTVSDGAYTVRYDGAGSQRIWKERFSDPENFTLTLDVTVLSIRAYVQVLGVRLELNASGGNGNQIYSPDADWFNAQGQQVTVRLHRENGGALDVTYTGKNGDTVNFTKTPSDGSSKNLELGVIDNGGSATFANIALGDNIQPPEEPEDPPASGKTPGDFGWFTDNNNYSGWTVDEEGTIYSVSHNGTNSKRIWQELLTDPENFSVTLDVTVLSIRAYVQVLGMQLELNASGGNGNQIYSPQYGNWFNAQGQQVAVTLTREQGGDLAVTFAGKNGDTIRFTKAPADGSNMNLELGVIDAGGSATFSNLNVILPEPPAIYTVTWDVDGNISTEEYEEGAMPLFKGDTAKAPDENYTYTFAGWEPALAPVTCDVTYTARYISTPIEQPVEIFTVTWNVDGVITTEAYEEGAMPEYKGSTDKAADENYTYTFVGWEPELAPVTCDVTYTAVYEQTRIIRYYTVTWNVDGNISTEEYEEGAMPQFKGDTAKASDGYRSYTFVGWEPELAPVTCDVTYTALYTVELTVEFTDVAEQAWYYDEVYEAVELGLFTGMGEGRFAPDATMTRAMLVTVLYRLAGAPEVEGDCPFGDVPQGIWYEQAVIWAAGEGITTGITAQRFAPDAPITRQQMVTILFRYAAYAGRNTDYRQSISYFPDSAQVADYALDAMKWALYLKIITGVEENGSVYLRPEGEASRAQVAAILVRFLNSEI